MKYVEAITMSRSQNKNIKRQGVIISVEDSSFGRMHAVFRVVDSGSIAVF